MRTDMNIVVMDRGGAVSYSFSPHIEESAVVSISTNMQKYHTAVFSSPSNHIHAVLRLCFDDVEGGPGCMQPEDASKIRQFVEANKDRKIIVHCDAGISRSAGIAAALMKFYNGDDSMIFDSPRYRPNMLCYRLMLNELNDWERGRNMTDEQYRYLIAAEEEDLAFVESGGCCCDELWDINGANCPDCEWFHECGEGQELVEEYGTTS
jgi:predicted protein tyrosine phosphatase